MLRRWLNADQPIGCSFTERHVRLAQITGCPGGGWKLVSRQQAVPDECARDPERRQSALPKLVRDMLKDSDFCGRSVVSALAADDVWYRSMRLAPMPDNELTTAAHWVAAKELGVNVDTFKSEALRIGSVREADSERVEVVSVGANVKALDDHAAMLVKAGLVPLAIDAAPCAAARLLTGDLNGGGKSEEETLLILDLGGRGSTAVVAAKGEVRFLHGLGGGLSRVADLLAQRLAVPAAAAEELLALQAGSAADPTAPLPHGVAADALADGRADAWGMFGRELARDVSRSLDHYCELLGGAMPAAAVMIGPAAADAAFADAFADLTGVPLRALADVLGPEKVKAMGVPPDELGSWVVPAGLSFYHGRTAGKGKAS